MNTFRMPEFEVSWDLGNTWQPYSNCIGEKMLARIVAPDGTVLWTGHAEYFVEKCGGCGGTGRSRLLRYVTDSQVSEALTGSGHE